jgi:hypothetical protein
MALGIPLKIVAGDYIRWTSPMMDGVLNWAIRGPDSCLDLTATIEDDYLVTEINSEDSANLTPGKYGWQAYQTVDNKRRTVATGTLEVIANFFDLDIYDGSTYAEKMLAQIQTAIQSVLLSGQAYKIGEREFTRANLNELREWETRLKFQVYREQKAVRGESPNLKIRFRKDYG